MRGFSAIKCRQSIGWSVERWCISLSESGSRYRTARWTHNDSKIFDFNFEEDPMESAKSLHGFEPSSRKKNPFNVNETTTSSSTATEKERMIFANLVDSLLSQTSTGNNLLTSQDNQPNSGGPMSQSLHTLFEQTLNKSSSSKSRLDPHVSSTVGVTSEEWQKNLPLSFGTLSSKSRTDLEAEGESENKEKYRQFLDPVLKHLSELQTDAEVVRYYQTKILDRYNAETELDTIDENFCIDIENPPLVRNGLSLYLVQCMNILNDVFRDPTAAIALFDLSKKNGIAFYASTCTVDVYNKMLEIKWVCYRDLYSIENLLLEMLVNAVMGNRHTIELLNDISHQSIDAKHGVSGLENMPLWSKEDDLMIQNIGKYRLKFMTHLSKQEGYDFI